VVEAHALQGGVRVSGLEVDLRFGDPCPAGQECGRLPTPHIPAQGGEPTPGLVHAAGVGVDPDLDDCGGEPGQGIQLGGLPGQQQLVSGTRHLVPLEVDQRQREVGGGSLAQGRPAALLDDFDGIGRQSVSRGQPPGNGRGQREV